MREITGNLLTYREAGHWIAITTNGSVTMQGACVMGAGIAQQIAIAEPDLPFALGDRIRQHGNRVHLFTRWKLLTFPVKRYWNEAALLPLIRKSAMEIMMMLNSAGMRDVEMLYTVRAGCGNGGLHWSRVKPLLASIFDDRVIIVERTPNRIADARQVKR